MVLVSVRCCFYSKNWQVGSWLVFLAHFVRQNFLHKAKKILGLSNIIDWDSWWLMREISKALGFNLWTWIIQDPIVNLNYVTVVKIVIMMSCDNDLLLISILSVVIAFDCSWLAGEFVVILQKWFIDWLHW